MRFVEARGVLGGAYRGRQEERACLIHYYDVTAGKWASPKTLCGRVKSEKLCDVAEDGATCAPCAVKFAKLAAKGAAVLASE